MKKITVLMAVYNPKLEWLEKQLKSINEQTYPNVELIIYDDYSSELRFDELESIVKRCVYRVPYILQKNSYNMGSTKTFEKLTEQNISDYFAYCDQDDIWEKEKLYKELQALKDSGGIMVCTNANAINDYDQIIKQNYMSIPEVLKKKIKLSTVWSDLLIKNYFWGCTMLIKSEVAKKALPFPDNMYHDHYLALYAAIQGQIAFLDEAQVKYRIHGNNQTGFLKNIFCKQDYIENRICMLRLRYTELLSRELSEEKKESINKLINWTLCREKYANGHWRQFMKMLKYIKLNKATTLFEILTMPMPGFMWIRFVRLLKWLKTLKTE
ncbi:MAG: glycosyltransferase [Paenibacillaceae bacterium]|nr:glycosyltransferase [Paenibacillaceae bacterium]